MTKHQYYLQLRKDILEERVRCDLENAVILASLALQTEFGDYQPEVRQLEKSDDISFRNVCFWCQITIVKCSAARKDVFQDGALPPRLRAG